ncbi:Phenylacetate--CoA ligase family protein [Vibrio chagasii]|nr:Phenylacetate--CoA ligase family protein [Vibrio chagasii]CAH7053900.1 Phenylacetate--CoA ligase family protein [Vibrio chagasii]CAH7064756.1 Phenylacetate--CoA ligase family protein [Vibrio chagasii]CAH7362356.1 Phenylacetate--CoA ligase family protein [Vibrio chagasii]CAH7377787.1 Phenylacetate--CoA ligase family protein [Vibrio chagasii]
MNLEKIYHKIKFLIPQKFLYASEYFDVIGRLNSNDYNNDELLKEHLIYCIKHVPYYRDNIKISDPQSLAGHELIKLFPLITKEVINEEPSRFISDKYDVKKLMHSSSGGSTGVGIQVWYEKSFTDIERAFFDYEWGKLGFSFKSSRILRFGSDALKKADEYPCERIGRKLACSPYHFNDECLPIITRDAEKFQPEFIHGYPSLVYKYLKYLDETGSKLPCSLKGCLLASEPVLDYQLRLIQKYFGNSFSINYGLTERNVIAFSEIVDNKVVYKLNSLYCYYENNKTKVGYEIVGTSLWNKVMPLVRYRTKDYGLIENGIIKNLEGREQDFAITKSGDSLPVMSVSLDKYIWNYVDDIQLSQDEPGLITYNLVQKKNVKNFKDSDTLQSFKISQENKWGSFFDLNFKFVDEIILTSSGKKKLFVSKL